MTLIFGRLFLFYFVPILTIISAIFFAWDCDLLVSLACLGPLSIVAWTVAYWVFELVNHEIVTDKNKIVVITGCDSGFGFSLAKRLDRFGFHVFAGVYSLETPGAKALQTECSHRIKVVPMDVTKQEQIDAVVQQVADAKLPLHAVVNNAGILFKAPFDFGEKIDVLEKTFDVNVYGMVRTTKAFVNLLRASKGRVVNVASAAGRITPQLFTYYCMSKHSVRAFSDGIRRELGHFGIKIVTIEPYFYKTEILNFERMQADNKRLFDQSPEETRQAYGEKYFDYLKRNDRMIDLVSRTNREEVVDALEQAVINVTVKPFIRCCDFMGLISVWVFGLLPETFVDFVLSFI